MQSIRWLIIGVLVSAGVHGCSTVPVDGVSDISAWGLGWQLRGLQNRVQPAIPPVLRFLRQAHPEVRPAVGRDDAVAEIRRAMMGFEAEPEGQLQRRLVGVFLVTELPCGARAYPVSDRAVTVAAFVVLDVEAIAGDPSQWRLCNKPVAGDNRAAALRALIRRSFEDGIDGV